MTTRLRMLPESIVPVLLLAPLDQKISQQGILT